MPYHCHITHQLSYKSIAKIFEINWSSKSSARMSSDTSPFISDINSLAEKNNRRKKISYGWFDIAIAWIFGVGFCFGDTIGDVYSTVQLYYINKSESSNQSDAIDNGSNTTCHQDVTLDGKSPTLRFWLSISFLVISLLYISCKSIVTYWREEKKKLTGLKPLRLESLWIALRWLCHFPPFFAAPAARYYVYKYTFIKPFINTFLYIFFLIKDCWSDNTQKKLPIFVWWFGQRE